MKKKGFKKIFIYRKIKDLPIDNEYFGFKAFNTEEGKVYLLSDHVNQEMVKLKDGDIKMLYHISRRRLEEKNGVHNILTSLLIPMLMLFISIFYIEANAGLFVIGLSIFIYTIYLTVLSDRMECEKSYCSFYLEKLKHEADRRGILL